MPRPKKIYEKQEVPPIEHLAEDQERMLLHEFGPILTGERLMRTLGYPSLGSLRQAIKRRTVPVPVFPLKSRRGRYALTKDVARWLAELQAGVAGIDPNERD